MSIGTQNDSLIGPDMALYRALISSGGMTTFNMTAITACFAARFQAKVAKKPKSIVLRWGTVTGAGTVQLGVETIVVGTPSKPNASRTLYDANATIDVAPVNNTIQTYTFASLPTANVTVGTEYAVTLRTSVAASTTQSLSAYIASGAFSNYPAIALTSTDSGTTWAEVASSVPSIAIIWDDDTCEDIGFTAAGSAYTAYNIFSTTVAGQKIITNNDNYYAGVVAIVGILGTPAGDLRCRIFDSAGNAVSGAAVTVTKGSVFGVSDSRVKFIFPAPVSLVAGTYRVILDSVNSANSSNCYRLRAFTFLHASAVTGHRSCTASDGSADSTTQITGVALLVDSQVAGGGGGGPVSGNIRGGFVN